jgi:nitrate reductase cytochrome c-type subunit
MPFLHPTLEQRQSFAKTMKENKQRREDAIKHSRQTLNFGAQRPVIPPSIQTHSHPPTLF